MPNFFADDLGVRESLRPIFYFKASWENATSTLHYRVALLFVLLAGMYWAWTQPTDFDEFVSAQRQFVDELYEGTLLSDKSQVEKEKD